jgi:glycosyltransferase involved in cell wall biosynthesis
VLANSQFTASTFASFSPARVCPCPVLPSRPARARTEVRAALGNTGEPVVIQTSRLEPWKGHRLLLDALSTLDQPWQLWIAGGQPRAIEVRVRKELEQLARERGVTDRVRFLGERDDLGDFLGAADVFCQPNVAREPFGITVLEAMSVGLPIVATDLGATADPIDPEIGRRVSAAPAALAAALGELLRNPDLRASLAKAARLRFEAFHSPTAAVRQLSTELTSFTRRSEAGGRLTWA